MTKITYIPGEIANAAIDEHGNRKPVTRTQHIFDDTKGKSQAEINADVDANINQLSDEIDAVNKQDIIPVDTLPAVATADPKKIYRVVGEDSYTDYMVNASGDGWKELATYSFPGTDDEPTAGSDNLVKSGGVQNELALSAVYDVSAKNPTAGPNNNGKWESLSALLSDANLNTLIPTAFRKGGMSIKFVQSSDNKYVQYRLMSDTFNTTPTNWLSQSGQLYIHQEFAIRHSSTSNLLDWYNQICDYKLVAVGYNLEIQKVVGARISHLIPVSGLTKMTFDGFVDEPSFACFLSDYQLKNSNIVDWFYLKGSRQTGTRTINVPSGSRYCVVTMGASDSNRSVSNTDSVTNEPFVLSKIVLIGIEELGLDISRTYKGSWMLRKSKTTNMLDVTECIFGYKIDSNHAPVFSRDENYYCTHFIDCSDLSQITVSGFPAGATCMFASKPYLDGSYFPTHPQDTYYIGARVRTLTIPDDKKFFIACYGIVGTDISNAKVSNSETETTDNFVISSIEKYKENVVFLSETNNILDITKYRTDIRVTDDAPYIVPAYTMSRTGVFVIRGLKEFTIVRNPSMTFGDGTPWMAFVKDLSLTQDSVISVVDTRNTLTWQVPNRANFAILMLNTSRYPDTLPWADTKVSNSAIATDDEYRDGLLAYIDGIWYNEYNKSLSANYDYEFVANIECQDFEKRAIPYTIGTPNGNVLSFDNAYNRFNILMFTDNHIDVFNQDASFNNVVDVIKYLNTTRLPIQCSINCGDFITPFGQSLTNARNRAIKYFDALKESNLAVMQAIGNHDANDWTNPPQNVLIDTDWSELYFAWMQSKLGTIHDADVVGYKTPYYYKDFNTQRIRVICLNAQDIPHGENFVTGSGYCQYYGGKAWYIRQQQFDWFINTALDFSNKENKNWGVIVFMHQDYRYGVRQYDDTVIVPAENGALRKVFLTLKALNTQTQYADNYICQAESEFDLDIDADFTGYAGMEQKPFVIGVFVGHEHADDNKVYEGINLIYTANGSATTNSSDARVARIVGTNTQNLFDLFSIDVVHKKIYATRYGAGLNCYGVGGDRFKPDGLSF